MIRFVFSTLFSGCSICWMTDQEGGGEWWGGGRVGHERDGGSLGGS